MSGKKEHRWMRGGALSAHMVILPSAIVPPHDILSTKRHCRFCFAADPEGPGFCAMVLTGLALLLVIVTLPFSLCTCIKVVAEYERSVIFRLGRLRKGKQMN